MDLENQKRVKEFAEEYGAENLVVVLGAAEGEAAGLAAETVTLGDPTFAGPLTGVQLDSRYITYVNLRSKKNLTRQFMMSRSA